MSCLLRNRSLARKALVSLSPLHQNAQHARCLTTIQYPSHARTNDVHTVPPTIAQLQAVRLQAALPMIGFGFMDQTIMIHAGNAIDCTIGVSLGVSTLAAAAVGQIVANAGGILFGQSLERFFARFLWIPQTNLTNAQLSLAAVEKARFSGTFWGILAGCILGLTNLLFIDTQWPNERKSQAVGDSNSSLFFEIQVDNQHSLSAKHQPATTLTISGPDIDGMLAVVLTALKEEGYSVLEMSAKTKTGKAPLCEDVFVVRRNGEAIPEEELASLTQRLLTEKLLLLTQQSNGVKN